MNLASPLSPAQQLELRELEAEVRSLPPSAGAFLIASGAVGGIVLPGVPGLAIALLGGVVLAGGNTTVQKLDSLVDENAPALRLEAYRFVSRFFSDLNRRFPKGAQPKSGSHPE